MASGQGRRAPRPVAQIQVSCWGLGQVRQKGSIRRALFSLCLASNIAAFRANKASLRQSPGRVAVDHGATISPMRNGAAKPCACPARGSSGTRLLDHGCGLLAMVCSGTTFQMVGHPVVSARCICSARWIFELAWPGRRPSLQDSKTEYICISVLRHRESCNIQDFLLSRYHQAFQLLVEREKWNRAQERPKRAKVGSSFSRCNLPSP